VEDWKGYTLSAFGDLLLHDKFNLASNEVERELYVYLFQKILVCCKEVDLAKESKKHNRNSSKTQEKKIIFQLKGRIFLQNIHRVVNTSRNGNPSKQSNLVGTDG